jgi:hypothetical protein
MIRRWKAVSDAEWRGEKPGGEKGVAGDFAVV